MANQDQTKFSTKLQNARVLIIGGTSGIGYAVAEAALEYGADVTISSSNQERVNAKVAQLQKSYPSAKSQNRVRGFATDLSNPDTVEQDIKNLFEQTVKNVKGGKLDHVIFTAGDALSMVKLQDMNMKKILAAGQIRFFAPLLVGKYVEQHVERRQESSYTVTTGGISEKPMPDWSVIAAYAGGHHSMVRNLALDLKPIRVCGVSPGVVDTELWKMGAEQKKAFMEHCAKGTATGTPGMPEDVAESYVCIMKDKNMDGVMLRTDGGHLFM